MTQIHGFQVDKERKLENKIEALWKTELGLKRPLRVNWNSSRYEMYNERIFLIFIVDHDKKDILTEAVIFHIMADFKKKSLKETVRQVILRGRALSAV